MVGTTCGFVSRTLALIATPFILLISIFMAAGCWIELIKHGHGLTTAQKVVDGILGFTATIFCIIILFGFFALCLGNIRFTKIYKGAIWSYLVFYGLFGLVRIIVVGVNKNTFTESCDGEDDCNKAFTVAMVILVVIYIVGMINIGLLIFLLRSSIVTMEGGMNSDKKSTIKHGYSSQSYAPLMDPTHETGYSQPYNPPQKQSYRDSAYSHHSQMSHSSTPSLGGNTAYPPVSTYPPQGYNHA